MPRLAPKRRSRNVIIVPHSHCFLSDQATDIEIVVNAETLLIEEMRRTGKRGRLDRAEYQDVLESFRDNAAQVRDWFDDPRVYRAVQRSLQQDLEGQDVPVMTREEILEIMLKPVQKALADAVTHKVRLWDALRELEHLTSSEIETDHSLIDDLASGCDRPTDAPRLVTEEVVREFLEHTVEGFQ